MFFERLVLYSYRWMLEKPTFWISTKILSHLEKKSSFKNRIR